MAKAKKITKAVDLSQKVDSMFCLSKLNILGDPDKIRCPEIIDRQSDSCKMVLVVIKEVPYKIERCRVRRRQ